MRVSPPAVMAIAVSGVLACAALVERFPPALYTFYPLCPIFRYTGLQCPGCGATRAFADLIHGQPGMALHHNVLFVAMVPLLASYVAVCLYRLKDRRSFRWPAVPTSLVYTLLVVAAVFTVARNLLL